MEEATKKLEKMQAALLAVQKQLKASQQRTTILSPKQQLSNEKQIAKKLKDLNAAKAKGLISAERYAEIRKQMPQPSPRQQLSNEKQIAKKLKDLNAAKAKGLISAERYAEIRKQMPKLSSRHQMNEL